jgi:hypothetical protein
MMRLYIEMSSSEEKLNEVPPGVSYGERVDVPVGNGKAKGLVDTGYEGESNPRIYFYKVIPPPKNMRFSRIKKVYKNGTLNLISKMIVA